MEPTFGRLSFVSVKKINVTRRWEIYQQALQLKQPLLKVLGFDISDRGNVKLSKTLSLIVHFLSFLQGSELECYFCQSDDHHLLEECNAEHPGGIVKCQQEDGDAPHFGRYCTVGHTGMLQIFKSKQLWVFTPILNDLDS